MINPDSSRWPYVAHFIGSTSIYFYSVSLFSHYWQTFKNIFSSTGNKDNILTSIWPLLHDRIFCPVQRQTGSAAGQSSFWHEAAPKNRGADPAHGPRSLQEREEGGGGAVAQQPAGAGEGARARQQPQHHLLSQTEEILTTVLTGLGPQANQRLSNAFYTLEFSKLTSFHMFSMRFVYWSWWFYPMRMLPVSVQWCRQHGQIVSVLQGGGKSWSLSKVCRWLYTKFKSGVFKFWYFSK